MNLVLFYVWEDASVCAHWNHSFDMQLNSAGPVSCFSPPWIPSGCTVEGVTAVAYGLMATTSFVYWKGRWHSLFTLIFSIYFFPTSLIVYVVFLFLLSTFSGLSCFCLFFSKDQFLKNGCSWDMNKENMSERWGFQTVDFFLLQTAHIFSTTLNKVSLNLLNLILV